MPHLHFKGKTFVQNHHLAVPFHELIPVTEKGLSAKPSLHDNLILQGDNLKALKALLPAYSGKVKCIYIDPPYNTGNEGWAYNDNVNSPMMQSWLGQTVDREDLTRHDKWCCMMLPRLKLLRELLTEDGAIFVSIDDNEVHHLRCLMDEVFGEENFVANVIWHKMDSPKNTAIHLSEDHDHIVLYARNAEIWRPNLLPRSDEMIARYKNPDNDPRGPWLLSDLAARNEYRQGRYSIRTPSGKVIQGPPAGSYWRVSEEKFEELDKDGRIWWGDSGSNRPGIKRFLSDVKDGVVPQTIWHWKEAGSTRNAKQELSKLMELESSQDVFITPKPVKLLARILQIATDKDSIILDSFAGSGTTAHAVAALNAEDGGNRRFVLVECEDYADSVTAERILRVMRGVPTAKDAKLKAGYGGTFSYFQLGEALEKQAILDGEHLPGFEALAGYVYFTATGEQFDAGQIDRKTGFIGESRNFDVFLIYVDDLETLKDLALTRTMAEGLPSISGKPKLVYAPTKYLDDDRLRELRIEFQQLPFEIYKRMDGRRRG
ncbi:MAG: site-specific DNA-methyltransferase [Opitutales bacterium]|nr:site-specific DNA-methyltransferase [Opitutales bacterium]